MEPSDYEIRKRDTIALITATFDGVERGDGVTLHEALVLDDYGQWASPEQHSEARALDMEPRWQDVPHEDIRAHSSVFYFLDPLGVRYYLPAYLVWYLENIDNEDPAFYSDTFMTIEYTLDIGLEKSERAYFLERFALITPEQSRTVAQFLVFIASRMARLTLEEIAKRENELTQAEQDSQAVPMELELRRNRLAHLREHGWGIDDARDALERYWGQFL